MTTDESTKLLQSALHELSRVRGQRGEELHEAERNLGEGIIHGNGRAREQLREERDQCSVSLHDLDALIVSIRQALGTADVDDDIPF